MEPRRGSWQASPSGPPSLKSRTPVSAGSFLGLLWKLALLGGLGVGGYYAYQYAPGIWSKIRLNSDVESASVFFMRQLPRQFATEADLQHAITNSADDKLKTYLAYKARWYVGYGQRGDELKVVRNDDFKTLEMAFVTKSVEQARQKGDVAGTETQVLNFPRGSLTRTVSVGNTTYYVVAGWTEEGK